MSFGLQASDSVELCSFVFGDQSRWKAMSRDALQSVCTPGTMSSWPSLPPLCGPTLDAGLVSNDLEQEIRALVVEYRRVGVLTGLCMEALPLGDWYLGE